ncbi:MAG: hypothetical protein AAF329_11900 [Cyanobacteria bacterium P01_A01_bin.17]
MTQAETQAMQQIFLTAEDCQASMTKHETARYSIDDLKHNMDKFPNAIYP